ncbi:hypothetical protein CVT24_003795 [Panaeolus cyanescens]|uniref:DUF6589 domain-containing protein n=1 Tax=Panaeolus cyanescens TaxID=181874 RepID=A0A409WN87_9AGAR|nr:hypothetical protein CVT24_003795 [Panaeolus cyanescens]
MNTIRQVLDPGNLANMYCKSAPFTWSLLMVFTTSPNRYRKERQTTSHPQTSRDTWNDDEEVVQGSTPFEGTTGVEWKAQGFIRNPTFSIIFAISMMIFTRNSYSNLFPMLFGLFLEVGGSGSRVLSTLGMAGACVSKTTIERLKGILSADARRYAVMLMKSPTPYYLIFDNINIYLRKHQQRAFNKNDMIHATNAVAIALKNVPDDVHDLQAKLRNRGKRIHAKGSDITPTVDDQVKIKGAFEGLVAQLLLAYCPGSCSWSDRDVMLKNALDKMPSDRPLPVQKTDTRPLGVFNINEGSKHGIIKMIKELQVTSGLSEEEWASKSRIIAGDWLTTANFRSARRDRTNDIDAKHKGLLHRTWNAAKPNYADGKALIRHSLIARILYSLMLKLNITEWSKLSEWKPTPNDVTDFASYFVQTFANVSHAASAKKAQDDYLAHSIYFIRDALIFSEFEHAVSNADAGRVIRVLKFWAFSFRGAGLHNYAWECLEIVIRWKYELDEPMQNALERSWFVNWWGIPGRWIAADLYVEQLNFWVKRVFIPKGSGVTIDYIMEKGSSCVEIFRELSHKFSSTFGYADRARKHKEVKIEDDLRILCQDMLKASLHILTPDRPILVTPKPTKSRRSEILNDGKFSEFIRTTCWDSAFGYPADSVSSATQDSSQGLLVSDTAYDTTDSNPISTDDFNDVDDGDILQQRCAGFGSLGGGPEYM